MPCTADPMPSDLDTTAHMLRLFHQELQTATPYNVLVIDDRGPNYPEGTTEQQVNDLTDHLCKRMSRISHVAECSLELQIWWREHQAADERRQAANTIAL